uniref:Uncharacterized protein n=1 Tax=Leersia perrieri TaxID=77586 RepID=A0A0D9X933_9ORYZ
MFPLAVAVAVTPSRWRVSALRRPSTTSSWLRRHFALFSCILPKPSSAKPSDGELPVAYAYPPPPPPAVTSALTPRAVGLARWRRFEVAARLLVVYLPPPA